MTPDFTKCFFADLKGNKCDARSSTWVHWSDGYVSAYCKDHSSAIDNDYMVFKRLASVDEAIVASVTSS